MQGTGTQENPYIPESWDEFVEAVGKSDVYVSMPEGGGVFDMNDIAPTGAITVQINCKEIQGNDWEIRNSYNIRFSIKYTIIRKLHILNFYNSSTYTGGTGPTSTLGGSFYECKFSGIIANRWIDVITGKYFYRCSMNLKLIGDAYEALSLSSSYASGAFLKIIVDHSDSKATVLEQTLKVNNSFIEHKTNADGAKIVLKGNSNVLHSDAGNCVTITTGEVVNVTEEQLKDAEYLRSIGFPIAGDQNG